jgi:two-component system response regulator
MSEIVLVDDNADHVDLMLLALHALDVKRPVVTFSSGEACVAAVEQGGLKPRLVLLDVNMPGLDGPGTAQRLRGLDATRSVPIVMLSSSAQSADVRRARDAGANSYVVKPQRDQTWQSLMGTLTRYWTETDHSGQI